MEGRIKFLILSTACKTSVNEYLLLEDTDFMEELERAKALDNDQAINRLVQYVNDSY